MTALDDTVASKAEEEFVLLGDPEKTTALPDLPRNSEPADKQNKTIVAETPPPRVQTNKQDKTIEATHAAKYETALKEAAPDAPPSVGDAAAALKDATLRELGVARTKASTKIKAAARAARRNAPAWRRVGRWALGLLALAVVFTSGFFLGEQRSRVASVPTQVSKATTPAATDAPVAETVKPTPPTPPTGSPTCRKFDGVVKELLGLRTRLLPRRAEPLSALVRQLVPPPRTMVPITGYSFGWPGLELRVRHADAAQVRQRRIEERQRLEHAHYRAARRRAQAVKAAAINDLEERLVKAEERRLRLVEQRTTESMPVVETAAVDAEPAVEPTPAPTRPARDALRELSIKQLRNILASRGGAPCTTCKEKDDLVAAVMAVLDD